MTSSQRNNCMTISSYGHRLERQTTETRFNVFLTFPLSIFPLNKMSTLKTYWDGNRLTHWLESKNQAAKSRHSYCYLIGRDESSPENHTASKIANLLPIYERQQCSHYNGVIRGVAILVYSPTNSTYSSFSSVSSMGMNGQQFQFIESNENRRFTPQLLYDVIQFDKTDAAKRQYRSHDNPMHRVFGIQ